MGTFGHTTIGTKSESWYGGQTIGSKFTIPENCNLASIDLYTESSSGSKATKVAIYDVTGSYALLANSSPQNISTPAWYHFEMSPISLTSAHVAGLCAFSEGMYDYRDAATAQSGWMFGTYPTFPDPWTAGFITDNRVFSIYATYTTGGGVSVKKGSCVPAMTALLTKFSALKQPREPKFQPRTFPKFSPRILV